MKKTVLLLLLILGFHTHLFSQTASIAIKVSGMHLTSVLHDSKGFIYAFGNHTTLDHKYVPNFGYETPTYFKVRKYDPSSGDLLWEKNMYSAKILAMSAPSIVNDQIYMAGYFSDTVTGDFGAAVSAGGTDFIFAQLDMNGVTQMQTSGGAGDEQVQSFIPDGNGDFYFGGRINGNSAIGAFSQNFSEPHAFLSLAGTNFSKVSWIRLAKAYNGASLAAFPNLNRYKNVLYSSSLGVSKMLDTSCIFGFDDFAYQSDRWDLNGFRTGIIPEGFTYSAHSFLLGDDAQGNYYSIHNAHYKGPHTINMNKFNHKGDSLISSTHLLDEDVLFHLLSRDNKFILATWGNNNGSAGVVGNNILEFDRNSLNIQRSMKMKYSSFGLFPFYMRNYLNDNVLIFGELPEELDFGNMKLKSDSANAKNDYIAVINWQVTTASTEQTDTDPAISISPNPGTGYFKISVSDNAAKTGICVRDVCGKIVHQQVFTDAGETSIDLSRLGEGIYFVEVNSENSFAVKKLIIQ
jgi:hypothetical protein